MTVIVVAAVVEEGGRFLITRRQQGVHLAGFWEFPGGKVQQDETHAGALKREMQEELDVDVDVGRLILETSHSYDERRVTLYFYRCVLAGTPRPLLGQEMRWVDRLELRRLEFPAADAVLIDCLAGGPEGPPLRIGG